MIITGGFKAAINGSSDGGFNASKALSTLNETPDIASRPFDIRRDGFVIGEGAGALVLEEWEHTKSVLCYFSYLAIIAFNGIGGVN